MVSRRLGEELVNSKRVQIEETDESAPPADMLMVAGKSSSSSSLSSLLLLALLRCAALVLDRVAGAAIGLKRCDLGTVAA
jgi:hypothetical protein